METSSQDRNLPASQRKLQKARDDGQVARSTALSHLAVLGAGALAILALSPIMFEQLKLALSQQLVFDAAAVLQPGTMRADPEGRLWILPSTSSQSGGGLLYDVVNRKGEIVERVRIPAGRLLAGFGAKGVMYLTARDATGNWLERTRLVPTPQ